MIHLVWGLCCLAILAYVVALRSAVNKAAASAADWESRFWNSVKVHEKLEAGIVSALGPFGSNDRHIESCVWNLRAAHEAALEGLGYAPGKLPGQGEIPFDPFGAEEQSTMVFLGGPPKAGEVKYTDGPVDHQD